jgi:uncharacterized protein (TIGR04562 family)
VLSSTANFEFPWPLFRGVLQGNSILDVPRLDLKTIEEATDFIHAYGFDPNSSEDMELLWGFFDEAIVFIERSLANPLWPRIPDHLRSRDSVKDLRRLLLLASGPMGDSDQLFACAILRLMHVLAHLAHDPRLKYFDQVQSQVLNRLDNYLYVNEADGALYLGRKDDGEGIKLLFFKKKDRKDREREIIKLLHKKDSLVEDIYDRMGFRLVTETKFDAVRAVRLMLKKNIISVPNIRPGRSRNRLVDLDRLQFEVDRIRTHLEKKGESAPYIEKLVKRLERRIGYSRLGRSLINPFTSEHYQAIQFTCRELVRVKDPLYFLHKQLKEQLENIHGGSQILQETFPKPPARAYSYVFFSYEIQIMDVKAYADSIFGKSNHEEYRRKQLETARARVFGQEIPDGR